MSSDERMEDRSANDINLIINAVKQTDWFRNEMLRAFKHGIEFEQLDHEGGEKNLNEVDIKHYPFYEWFYKEILKPLEDD